MQGLVEAVHIVFSSVFHKALLPAYLDEFLEKIWRWRHEGSVLGMCKGWNYGNTLEDNVKDQGKE